MIWNRISAYAEQSDQGHRVSASKGADGWRYAAWGAPLSPELSSWDWMIQTAQEHYPRGTQRVERCALLGIFETAAEARAACAATETSTTAAEAA